LIGDPLEVRKATLANVLAGVCHGIWFNDHIEDDGPTVFKHACKLGLEGIVWKRKDSPDRSGQHGRPLHRFGDRLGITVVVLVPLRNGLTYCAGIKRTSCPSAASWRAM
jgi:hypothetical protein